jgi:hypothetical protein
MVYLFCGLFGGAILAMIVQPLFRKDDSLDSAIIEETEWDLLQRKKEVILGNIQDLDFEFKCGKLSEEDYKHVRADMSADASAVLKQIDEIEATHDVDALIRREVNARRSKNTETPVQSLLCPSCALENPVTNKFCAECGVKLKSS